jgi:hypothetical protein
MRFFRSAHSVPVRIVVTAGLLVGALSGPAFAAGGGYGVVPPGPTHPPGFSGVVCAKSFGKLGGDFECTYFKLADIHLLVPKGRVTQSYQVVFTPGHAPTVAQYLEGLPGYTSVLSFGILFQYQSTSTLFSKGLGVLITDPQVKKGDVITEYFQGHFVEIGVVHNNGILILYPRGGDEYAIVAPPPK